MGHDLGVLLAEDLGQWVLDVLVCVFNVLLGHIGKGLLNCFFHRKRFLFNRLGGWLRGCRLFNGLLGSWLLLLSIVLRLLNWQAVIFLKAFSLGLWLSCFLGCQLCSGFFLSSLLLRSSLFLSSFLLGSSLFRSSFLLGGLLLLNLHLFGSLLLFLKLSLKLSDSVLAVPNFIKVKLRNLFWIDLVWNLVEGHGGARWYHRDGSLDHGLLSDFLPVSETPNEAWALASDFAFFFLLLHELGELLLGAHIGFDFSAFEQLLGLFFCSNNVFLMHFFSFDFMVLLLSLVSDHGLSLFLFSLFLSDALLAELEDTIELVSGGPEDESDYDGVLHYNYIF